MVPITSSRVKGAYYRPHNTGPTRLDSGIASGAPRLKADPVDDALVVRLIELALKAPPAETRSHCEFIVVKERAVKAYSPISTASPAACTAASAGARPPPARRCNASSMPCTGR
jgi:hypothetical protein